MSKTLKGFKFGGDDGRASGDAAIIVDHEGLKVKIGDQVLDESLVPWDVLEAAIPKRLAVPLAYQLVFDTEGGHRESLPYATVQEVYSAARAAHRSGEWPWQIKENGKVIWEGGYGQDSRDSLAAFGRDRELRP